MPSTPARRFVSDLLDRSRGFFERDGVASLAVAAAVVTVVAVAVTLGIVALGVVFDATIDETITVENENRPPDWVCEDPDEDSLFADRCDEPAEMEVDAGSELRDATSGFYHYGFLGVLLWWLVFGIALHAGVWFADGDGTVGDSFVVAAWALVPELFRLAAGLGALYYALSTAEITGGTAEAIVNDVVPAIESVQQPLVVATAFTVLLQWWIVVGGLEALHDLRRATAVVVSTVFAVLAFLLALV